MSLEEDETKKEKTFFTKNDTLFFKGLAMFFIILHNYYHRLPAFGLENEMSFNVSNVWSYLSAFKTLNIPDIFYASMGFLGHFGVQLFILFSAYGLSLQFSNKTLTNRVFILSKLKKIYFLLALGIIFCIGILFLAWIIKGKQPDGYAILKSTLMLTTTIGGFLDDYMYEMFNGPFWFFTLIIQVYILFPLFHRIVFSCSQKRIFIPFIIAYLIIYPAHFILKDSPVNIWSNFIGHMPEVLLGITLARYGIASFKNWLVLTAGVTFVLSQFFEIFFPLSFLSISILLITLFTWFQHVTPPKLQQFILYTGKISMILFIVNGPFRIIPYIGSESDSPLGGFKIIPYLITLYIFSHLFYKVYDFGRKRLKI